MNRFAAVLERLKRFFQKPIASIGNALGALLNSWQDRNTMWLVAACCAGIVIVAQLFAMRTYRKIA